MAAKLGKEIAGDRYRHLPARLGARSRDAEPARKVSASPCQRGVRRRSLLARLSTRQHPAPIVAFSLGARRPRVLRRVGTLPFLLEHLDGQTTLAVEGEIDAANVDAFEAILDVVTKADTDTIIVDLTDLDFMDVRGINAMFRSRAKIESLGRSFVLRNPPQSVRRLLEVLGPDIAVEPNVPPAAVEAPAGPRPPGSETPSRRRNVPVRAGSVDKVIELGSFPLPEGREFPHPPRCAFCNELGRPIRPEPPESADLPRLVAGPGLFICERCVRLCTEIFEEDDLAAATDSAGSAPGACPAARTGERHQDRRQRRPRS
jgi:anti-anti-sigma factor